MTPLSKPLFLIVQQQPDQTWQVEADIDGVRVKCGKPQTAPLLAVQMFGAAVYALDRSRE